MDPSSALENPRENLKSIVCSNLHDDLNKKSILLNHFSQFGEVEGVSCSKVNKYAVIVFSNHADAKTAKEQGSRIHKDFAPVEIYLSAKTVAGVGSATSKHQKSLTRRTSGPEFSSLRKSSLAKRMENQPPRSSSKLSINFLQSNIRAYLTPPTGSTTGAETKANAGATATDSSKFRADRFHFVAPPSVDPIPKLEAPRTPPRPPEEVDQVQTLQQQDTKSIVKPKLFTFKLGGKEREKSGLGGRGPMEEAPSTKSDAQDSQLQLSSTDGAELQEMMYKRATTAEERYRLLDARDKLLRLKTPKVKVRVEFAVKLVGTCMDMCPEKERYMREFQRQLKEYECLSATDFEVDHKKAIKQYSRSSADQEEPLPHELRPTETLDMTMNYLLHNIVNRSENQTENLLEWYGFMWDRTRSIRKDITQQQLCDLKAVSLMEMCTRFHIHCSTRLCELDRHAFDPKLNDENLMKCLQSLEHMYGDLHVKGIQCPNESEFRSYQILMNLNEGDILWEIQQKPPEVLRSVQVQHALKIHLALSQKNFVAFFRLVKNSSYMTSCILHRYFYQVRSFALRRLIRAHSIAQFQTTMPTASVQKFLGFGPDDEHLLIEFCTAHGIPSDEYNKIILLSKKRLTNPEAPLIHREYYLIDSKLSVTVAEAIKGEDLGLNPLHYYTPYSSFDEHGYLHKSDEIFSKLSRRIERPALVRKSPEKQMSTAFPSVPPTSAPAFGNFVPSSVFGKPSFGLTPTTTTVFGKPSFGLTPATVFGSGQDVASSSAPSLSSGPGGFTPSTITTSAFGSSLFPTVKSTAFGGFTAPAQDFGFTEPPVQAPMVDPQEKLLEQFVQNHKQSVLNDILTKTVAEEVPPICSQTLDQLKTEARVEQLWVEVKQKASHVLNDQITGRTVTDMVTGICSSELSQARTLKIISREIGAKLEKTVEQELIRSVCSDTFKQAKIDRENNIRKAARLLSRVQLSIWIQQWQMKAAEKKTKRLRLAHKRKSDIENFPPSMSYSLSPASILGSWCVLKTSPSSVRINKTLNASKQLDIIGKSEEIRNAFTTYLEESSPNLLGFLIEPLCQRICEEAITARPTLPIIGLPPVVFNIVLLTEDADSNHVNCVWNGFLSECKRTSDENLVYKEITTHGNYYISIQKCVPRRGQMSSNSAGIVLFVYSEDFDFADIKSVRRPVSVIIFNYSSASQNQIRKRLRNLFFGTGLIHHLSILDMENDLAGSVCIFADAFNSFGNTLPLVTPMQPALAFPSLPTLVQYIIMEVFPGSSKQVSCPSALFRAYEKILDQVMDVVERTRHIGYPTDWPDKPTDLIADQEPQIRHLLPQKDWRTHPAGNQLQKLVKIARLDSPERLHQYSHKFNSAEISAEDLGSELKDYAESLCQEGVSSLELMNTTRDMAKCVAEGTNPFPFWKQLIYVCQVYRLRCLEEATKERPVQVCISIPHLLDLSIDASLVDTCRICSDCKLLPPSRKRSLTSQALGTAETHPEAKSSRKHQNSMLSDIYALIQEVKREKDCLLQNS